MTILICGACGYPAGSDYVGMVDACPCCKATPFVEFDSEPAPAHPPIGWERGELSERGIREAFESGRTATVRTAIIAGRPWSVHTVRVIKIEGDVLYCTTDGVWFTTVENDRYSAWSLDPEPPNSEYSTIGRAAIQPFDADDNSTYVTYNTDPGGEFGDVTYPLRRIQATSPGRDARRMTIWRVARVEVFTPDANTEWFDFLPMGIAE